MITVSNILSTLDSWAPIDTAEKWDNCGLQIGDPESNVSSILLSLDIDNHALKHIEQNNYDLIITHHPLFFTPIKQLNTQFDIGKITKSLINTNTALISFHTNLDKVKGGVNDCLIKKYKLNQEKNTS